MSEKLRELLESRRCSDHGCWFGHPGGMGTNGGCQHDKMNHHELRRDYRSIARALCEAVKGEA